MRRQSRPLRATGFEGDVLRGLFMRHLMYEGFNGADNKKCESETVKSPIKRFFARIAF